MHRCDACDVGRAPDTEPRLAHCRMHVVLAVRGGLFIILALAVLASSCGGYVLSPYGSDVSVSRKEDGTARRRMRRHRGVDLGRLSIGDSVLASAKGVVTRVEESSVSGIMVELRHAGGCRTRYVHLGASFVRRGQTLGRGDVLGSVSLFPGSGGVVHVHLELHCPPELGGAEYGVLKGTMDPMLRMVGCFVSGRSYTDNPIELTMPFRC